MTLRPRPARVEFESEVSSADSAERPSLEMMLPRIGPVIGHQGSFAFVGEHLEGSSESIILAVGRKGCSCGCGAPGGAFMAYMPADEARIYGTRLLELAEAAEAKASALATAAIDKARGK
ncbi:hypothetical protein CA223_05300 [Sphingomonas koreensis]|uniref:Uncharacterized protein n=1 Tax=Sphingomonas koreensis TaxID=93064 RepID=A0A1L6JBN5_9SPHN|nr:hypothetical protein [Sphingomonas koreensis]APR53332.1 hypothetical protein BRX40_13655 [Sphingomonas koreensis]MDC7809978.1 hypothetical protein [Sphingomonas koreensis]RSU24548.1 hypothetical protein CA224_02180 [Sphingomonas koreensis]RSU25193.1 hypothetical protein CA222_13775 [Sphingomonas koreensis]RSU30132.1 hypothetical protein CA225_05575 [Sphingomonas koreensis]